MCRESIYVRTHLAMGIRKKMRRRGERTRRESRKETFVVEIVMRVFMTRAPGTIRQISLFFFAPFARSSHEDSHRHRGTGTSLLFSPFTRRGDSLAFGKSFRLCDNWLPHRAESPAGPRCDPPAFNERHFSSFSIQPV